MVGLSKLTVLFVEDEEHIRAALESAIGEEFGKFILARDGEDGLKKFKKFFSSVISSTPFWYLSVFANRAIALHPLP